MSQIKKLALNINAFDASELLQYVLKEIRSEIDVVNAIWQEKSYWGNSMAKEDKDELNKLKEDGLIDNLIEFKPDFSKYSRVQECDKRNMGIQLAKDMGCSHVISSDADEFYELSQFKNAKKIINEKGCSITYCSYINYYRDFSHYLIYPFKPYVPFIHSTYFKYTYNGPAPGPTDPTRRINNPLNISTYLFENEEIIMHHAAWIRKDIRKKLENWSAKNHFKSELIDKAVERWSNWKEGDDAIMLFNVPDNSVKIKKIDKPFLNIKVDWL